MTLEKLMDWDDIRTVLKERFGKNKWMSKYQETIAFYVERAEYYSDRGFGPVNAAYFAHKQVERFIYEIE